MRAKVKVLLCDDHTLFREGVKAILKDDPSIEVAGEAENGREAVRKVNQLHPDVVLMDIGMPDLNGFEAMRRIRKADQKAKVLILTMYEEEDLIARCLEAGAAGYVLKDAPLPHLIHAIDEVSRGGQYLSPRALKKVIRQFVKGVPVTTSSYDVLTDREREILQLLADGLSLKEIAVRLQLSVKTVDAHKYNLMHKLDLHDRSQLIKYAIRKKLIRLPQLN